MSDWHFDKTMLKYLIPEYLYQYQFCLKRCGTVNLALEDTFIYICMNSCFKKFVDSLRIMSDGLNIIVAQKVYFS